MKIITLLLIIALLIWLYGTNWEMRKLCKEDNKEIKIWAFYPTCE